MRLWMALVWELVCLSLVTLSLLHVFYPYGFYVLFPAGFNMLTPPLTHYLLKKSKKAYEDKQKRGIS